MAMLCKQAAQAAVDLQLILQAWLVFKRTGDRPGKVPREMVAGALQMWEAQFAAWARIWALDSIPPWAVAVVLTGLCGSVQYAARTPQPPKGHFGQPEPVDAQWTEHSNGEQRKAA
jgi:hypothetical protein